MEILVLHRTTALVHQIAFHLFPGDDAAKHWFRLEQEDLQHLEQGCLAYSLWVTCSLLRMENMYYFCIHKSYTNWQTIFFIFTFIFHSHTLECNFHASSENFINKVQKLKMLTLSWVSSVLFMPSITCHFYFCRDEKVEAFTDLKQELLEAQSLVQALKLEVLSIIK